VKAYVVLGDGGTASAADLLAHCKRNLAPFKCPAEIVFVRELPHSATGKVRKGLLEKQGRGS
jgi:acyl-CoA synthetase (AMP-forming)/AMP-acid ligase II